MKDQRELGLKIADEGGWKEFYQKKHNYFMYDHHKNRRLMLQRQYKELVECSPREALEQTMAKAKETEDKRWIKIPGAMGDPGEWRDYDIMSREWGKTPTQTEVQWEANQISGWLETKISKEKPSDKVDLQEQAMAGVVSTRLEGHVPQQ